MNALDTPTPPDDVSVAGAPSPPDGTSPEGNSGASAPTPSNHISPDRVPVADVWRELVTTALLGTDRRDPPEVAGMLGDLVADTARSSPSERMLALVGATTAVRRAGVLPGPPAPPITPPVRDLRRACVPAATDRWQHITVSWPVLEDEWMLTLVANGWRLSEELVPSALRRHRADPVRHARTRVAAGPLGDWLIEQLPDLACAKQAEVDPEALAELPELPIPPELAELLDASGEELGAAVGAGVEHGEFGHAHRAVLVNLCARIPPSSLPALGAAFDRVDPHSAGSALAAVLSDLVGTRHRMLDELSVA